MIPTRRPLPRLRDATDTVMWARQLVEELQQWLYQVATVVGGSDAYSSTGVSATPPDPTAGEARVYIKDDKLVVQYNDGGTVRYKYLTLSGTSTTWTHATSAP